MNDLRNLFVRAGRSSNVFALRNLSCDVAVTHFRQQVTQTRITFWILKKSTTNPQLIEIVEFDQQGINNELVLLVT